MCQNCMPTMNVNTLCKSERERKRDRQTDREREKTREGEGVRQVDIERLREKKRFD